jgi:hypothetical protein
VPRAWKRSARVEPRFYAEQRHHAGIAVPWLMALRFAPLDLSNVSSVIGKWTTRLAPTDSAARSSVGARQTNNVVTMTRRARPSETQARSRSSGDWSALAFRRFKPPPP